MTRPSAAGTIMSMGASLRKRLTGAASVVLVAGWFVGALVIVTEWMHVEAQRGNLWILMLVFLAPFLALTAGGEFIHWIRNGRRQPGRHSRRPDSGGP